jgi:hypothetical protein
MLITAAEHDLLERFAALTYPIESLDHAEHVRLAWTLLAQQPLLEAMCSCRRMLLAYAEHHGAADKYNETITCIYLLLIRDAMDRLRPDHDWAEFQQINPDLFRSPKDFLERWYPDAGAFTPEAKMAFRLPS